jgi:hypothetical protein
MFEYPSSEILLTSLSSILHELFCQAQLSSLKPQLKLSFSFIPSFSPPTTPPHPTTGKVFKAQLQACANGF